MNTLNEELNQKITKASPEDTCYGAFTQGKIPMQKNLELKRRRAFGRRGHIFGSLWYVHTYMHTVSGLSSHLTVNH